jgi:hypothetical protein
MSYGLFYILLLKIKLLLRVVEVNGVVIIY